MATSVKAGVFSSVRTPKARSRPRSSNHMNERDPPNRSFGMEAPSSSTGVDEPAPQRQGWSVTARERPGQSRVTVRPNEKRSESAAQHRHQSQPSPGNVGVVGVQFLLDAGSKTS